jgi:hypothetical protein
MFAVAIIGAGAAGMYCASLLNASNVAVIEAGTKPARKLAVSGGGKCNITNQFLSSKNYLGNQNFINAALQKYDNNATIDLLRQAGIFYRLNPKIVQGTYFLRSSGDLITYFQKSSQNCRYFFDTKVSHVEHDECFVIHTNKGLIKAKNLVVASGGISYAQLGCSDVGYKIAQTFGHKVTPLNPALVGFTVQKQQFWFKKLSGVSLEASLKIENKTLQGNILFTHKGISGPAILSTSLYWTKGAIAIDFAPKVNLSKLKNSKQKISNSLGLPKRFVQEFLTHIGVEDKAWVTLSEQEFTKVQTMRSYEFAPAGNFGFTKAEVTKGGVSTDAIDADFQSMHQKGLFFLGEVLDVTGELGGYNIQWALTSAAISAQKLRNSL